MTRAPSRIPTTSPMPSAGRSRRASPWRLSVCAPRALFYAEPGVGWAHVRGAGKSDPTTQRPRPGCRLQPGAAAHVNGAYVNVPKSAWRTGRRLIGINVERLRTISEVRPRQRVPLRAEHPARVELTGSFAQGRRRAWNYGGLRQDADDLMQRLRDVAIWPMNGFASSKTRKSGWRPPATPTVATSRGASWGLLDAYTIEQQGPGRW